MRRGLSIFLILLFGLAPLAVALPGSEDLRLPPCCRHHGAHHCAMYQRMAAMMAQSAAGKHIFTAPSTCPLYPGYGPASTAEVYALAVPPVSLPVLLAHDHSPAASGAAALVSQIRTRAGRGPPASILI
ncbi:MAG: hypothetical protein WAK26_04835 [Terracidiphilus sp.]